MLVGTGVFIVQDNEILLMRRGPACSRGAGCWALPGGMVEDGETIYQTAVREIKEELNFTIYQPEVVSASHIHNDILCVWMRTIPYYEWEQPKIMESNKCSELAWMSIPEIIKKIDWNRPEQWRWIPINDWLQWYSRIFR